MKDTEKGRGLSLYFSRIILPAGLRIDYQKPRLEAGKLGGIVVIQAK